MDGKAHVSLWPERSASGATEPSGRVTVNPVQVTDSFAISEIAATAWIVEPSSGDAVTSAGARPAPPPPPEGGAGGIGVWFVTAEANAETLLAAASWSAFSAGTA